MEDLNKAYERPESAYPITVMSDELISELFDGLSQDEMLHKIKHDPNIQKRCKLAGGARELRDEIFLQRLVRAEHYQQELQPYVEAMRGVSGLTPNQAQTCVYYAILTYRYEQFPKLVPILLFLGATGTGKSEAIKEMEKFVNDPVRVSGSTYTDLGKGLNKAKTAVVEEGDKFSAIRCEYLLQQRCVEAGREQVIHVPPTQIAMDIDSFGCTIIHRRVSFSDTATRNRSVTIKTKRKLGNYYLSDVDKAKFAKVATKLDLDNVPLKGIFTPQGSNRISDAWYPLLVIADACCDDSFLEYAGGEIAGALRTYMDGEEPEDIAVKALVAGYHLVTERETANKKAKPNYDKNIKLKDIAEACNNRLMIKKSSQWLHRVLTDIGFEFSFGAGYDSLKANPSMLTELCKEKGYDM